MRISPRRGFHPAVPIAGNVSNAWTVVIREYHCMLPERNYMDDLYNLMLKKERRIANLQLL